MILTEDARRKKRRRRNDPYSYLPGSPIPEGPSDIEIRAALHWDNLLGRGTEPASALWSAEETEDVYLRYVDLSEAVDLTRQDSRKLPRPADALTTAPSTAISQGAARPREQPGQHQNSRN